MNAVVPFARLAVRRKQQDEPLTDIDLCAWIAQALPGDILEYHRGFLALDRNAEISHLNAEECERLDYLAERAFDAFEMGFVHLIQERLGANDYRYLAVARPKPEEPSSTILELLMPEAA